MLRRVIILLEHSSCAVTTPSPPPRKADLRSNISTIPFSITIDHWTNVHVPDYFTESNSSRTNVSPNVRNRVLALRFAVPDRTAVRCFHSPLYVDYKSA